MKRLTKNILATGAVIAASLLGVATPSALADTSTLSMGCYVDSWRYDYVQEGYCAAQDPALGYRVYFEVLGRSDQGYSYSWHTTSTSWPKVSFSVAYGCTSSSHYCAVDVRNRSGAYWELTSSAVVTELATGASKTVKAVAWGEPVCGSYFC